MWSLIIPIRLFHAQITPVRIDVFCWAPVVSRGIIRLLYLLLLTSTQFGLHARLAARNISNSMQRVRSKILAVTACLTLLRNSLVITALLANKNHSVVPFKSVKLCFIRAEKAVFHDTCLVRLGGWSHIFCTQFTPVALIDIDPMRFVALFAHSFSVCSFHLALSALGIHPLILPLCRLAAEHTKVVENVGEGRLVKSLFNNTRLYNFNPTFLTPTVTILYKELLIIRTLTSRTLTQITQNNHLTPTTLTPTHCQIHRAPLSFLTFTESLTNSLLPLDILRIHQARFHSSNTLITPLSFVQVHIQTVVAPEAEHFGVCPDCLALLALGMGAFVVPRGFLHAEFTPVGVDIFGWSVVDDWLTDGQVF